ncbi:TetR/AcrR family transcriptional regulator [Actinoallomurus rhizosphaericola]|uniref:TetR/AcrR family transcriptional regulator n=1 Tax=Actinoallomurus rhizosphaericola TaxID=2952536 RepID=UPI0020911E45|nr:TetR/AcrR family transcriptional regulator [Actinoallomurus rhizosphaericola]MCO5991940.1 TetR/AcrR family transcriptional regulator [Actinoallomurus rhizosphaericola]
MGAQDNGGRAPRRDALRNTARVVQAAREMVAECGLDVGYHDVAARAGVSAATVYRRFPERAELLEAVLLDVLDQLNELSDRLAEEADAWGAFEQLFVALAYENARNSGLSGSLKDHGGPAVQAARQRLLAAFAAGVRRAQADGRMREDVTWQDVLLLSRLPSPSSSYMDVHPQDDILEKGCAVVLAGLRPAPD